MSSDVRMPVADGPAAATDADSSTGRNGRHRTPPERAGRTGRNTTHRWVRWLHVYTSMIALLVVLFFGLTGITLNHPSWTFGDDATRETVSGTLPSGWDTDPVDFLAVTEYVRSTYGVSAPVSGYSETSGEGTVSFRGPGYAADLFFSTDDGSFDLTVEQQGFIGVMNDLHKGRDTNAAWGWVIDLSGGFLVVVAVSGLGIQLFLRKRRTRALVVAGLGAAATLAILLLTV